MILREIVAESAQRGGKGELTLRLKLVTTIPRGSPKVEARLEVSGKAPKMTAGVCTFFATPDGMLRRDDPSQLPLPGIGDNVVRITTARRSPKAAPKAKPEPKTKPEPKAEAKTS